MLSISLDEIQLLHDTNRDASPIAYPIAATVVEWLFLTYKAKTAWQQVDPQTPIHMWNTFYTGEVLYDLDVPGALAVTLMAR